MTDSSDGHAPRAGRAGSGAVPGRTRRWPLIGLGILMLTQPFSLDLYSYSFVTILAGTVGFVIVSHFPQ